MACMVGSVALIGMLVGCRTAPAPENDAPVAVRAVLDQQVRAWNNGDLDGFMEGYAKSERTRFASGGDITLGWQTVFDRYQKKYGTRAAMGTLSFSNVEIAPLGPDVALAFGGWHLKREEDALSGLFTLVFRKTLQGWRIVHDHTSSAEKK
jgi:ketosteroid isomerase-like protein